MQPAWMNEQYLNTLSKDAYWVTNDTGTGLMLVLDTPSGTVPIPTVNGTTAEVSFIELSKPRGSNEPIVTTESMIAP